MDILILGNGFDIAHGLKTKYGDFLDYCKNQLQKPVVHKPTNPYFTNLWIRHFLNIQQLGNTWIDLENEIFRVIKYIASLSIFYTDHYDGQFSISFNDGFFTFYNFDKYITAPIFSADTSMNGYIRFDEHNCIKYQVYFSCSKGIVNFLYNQLREFTILFEKYLLDEILAPLEEISKFQLSLKSIGVREGNKDVHVLSFNYTDTCERLYKYKFNTNCDIAIKPVYVHGKAEAGKSGLVLGTHSFYNYLLSNSNNEAFPVEFNVFKKHNQRHKYGTIEPYQELYRKVKKSRSIPNFHIIGHSLDNTDKNILKHILLANPNTIINIYYHDEEAQERLINRITEIIGEEEVMAKVRFIHQHDAERGILIPKGNI